MDNRSTTSRGDPPAALLHLGYAGLALSFGGAMAGERWGLGALLLGTAITFGGRCPSPWSSRGSGA